VTYEDSLKNEPRVPLTLEVMNRLIDEAIEKLACRGGMVVLSPDRMDEFRSLCDPLLVEALDAGDYPQDDTILYRGFIICDKTHEVEFDPMNERPNSWAQKPDGKFYKIVAGRLNADH
jgi:hypothetical protein